MPVLRSRKIVSPDHKEHAPKSGVEIEPVTPAKEFEVTNKSSNETTPSPDKLVQTSEKLGSGGSTESSSVSNRGLRRSARLSLNSSSCNVGESGGSRRKRKAVNIENGEETSVVNGLGLNVTDKIENESGSVRVSMEVETESGCETNHGVSVSEEEEMQGVSKDKNHWISSLGAEELGSESVLDADVGNRCLSLRSGKKLSKPEYNHLVGDKNLSAKDKDKEAEEREGKKLSKPEYNHLVGDRKLSAKDNDKEAEEREGEADFNCVIEGGITMEAECVMVDDQEMNIDIGNDVGGSITRDGSRFSIEEKGKGKADSAEWVMVDGEEIWIDFGNDANVIVKGDISKSSIEEKGKGKVVEVSSSSDCSDTDYLRRDPEVGNLMDTTMADTVSVEEETIERAGPSYKVDPKERFKNVAKVNASKFAFFSVQEEEVDEDESELPPIEANMDVEDWPGPFSTALKIIKDRAANMPAQQKNVTSTKRKSGPSIWVPKEKKQSDCLRKVAPSLEELCMKIMAENVDAITSLESVPDVLRNRLTQLLCDSRKMNHHFFDLLASGSPSEIRVRDCSWLHEQQFTETFAKTDTSKLMVLQLDQCGRCLPDYVIKDYVIHTTLAQLPSKLSALTNISVKGACRLSDAGLNALVASAPTLRSINLGCCSLLTSDGIINLAEKLGSVLKELYIDECFGIDAKSILPALLKLQQLEVLSISRLETVNDSFIIQFVAVQGHKMKELILADCTKLTDRSLKAIANSCPGLCAIDLANLCKLTDTSLGHLANGCQTIQTLKFCRNAFSDEAVAAYLEACGVPLKELSLNHVDKVAINTALSIAKHAKNLQSLDLSWCRDLTDEALGLIVDSCLSLKMLKLFGCTQVTNVFTDGHSNENVKIIGLKESQIVKNIEVPHLLPLRYSSI